MALVPFGLLPPDVLAQVLKYRALSDQNNLSEQKGLMNKQNIAAFPKELQSKLAMQDAQRGLVGAQTQGVNSRIPLTQAQTQELNQKIKLDQLYQNNPGLRPGMSQSQQLEASLLAQQRHQAPQGQPQPNNVTQSYIPDTKSSTQVQGQDMQSTIQGQPQGYNQPPRVDMLSIDPQDSLLTRKLKEAVNQKREKQNLALTNQYWQGQSARQKVQQGTANKRASAGAVNAGAILSDAGNAMNQYLQLKNAHPYLTDLLALPGAKSLGRNTDVSRALSNVNNSMLNAARQVVKAEFGTRSGGILKMFGDEYKVSPYDSAETAQNKFNQLHNILNRIGGTRSLTFDQVQYMLKNPSSIKNVEMENTSELNRSPNNAASVIGKVVMGTDGKKIKAVGINPDGTIKIEEVSQNTGNNVAVAPTGTGMSLDNFNKLPQVEQSSTDNGIDLVNRLGSDIGTSIGEGIGNLDISGDELLSKIKGHPIKPVQVMQKLASGNNYKAQSMGIPQNALDRGLISTLPYVATGLATGGDALPAIAGEALTGAIMSPNNRTEGAALGATLGAAGGLAGAAGRLTGKGIEALKSLHPVQKATQEASDYANRIVNRMTNKKGFSGIKVRIGDILKNNYTAKLNRSKELYNQALQSGKLENGDNLTNVDSLEKNYNNLSNEQKSSIPPALREKLEKTVDLNKEKSLREHLGAATQPKPISLDSAHSLQSDLGAEAAHSRGFTASREDKATAKTIESLRGALNEDLLRHLDKGSAGNIYRAARNYYRENVVPYKEVGKFVSGKSPNFTSIGSKFANADLDDVDKGNIAKLVEHGGVKLKNHIVSSSLKNAGETGGIINPKKLVTSYKGLEKSGLDMYLTPKTVQEMKNLEILNDKVDIIKKRINLAKRVGYTSAAITGLHELNGT